MRCRRAPNQTSARLSPSLLGPSPAERLRSGGAGTSMPERLSFFRLDRGPHGKGVILRKSFDPLFDIVFLTDNHE